MTCLAYAALLLLSATQLARAEPKPPGNQLFGSSFGIPVDQTFDYVIVGGGNAGLTVASRLSEDEGVSVAVVEAGSFYEITNGNLSQIPANDIFWTGKDPKDVNPLVDWGFTSAPQEVHHARPSCFSNNPRSADVRY
jgi:choline dehydrogenase